MSEEDVMNLLRRIDRKLDALEQRLKNVETDVKRVKSATRNA